MKKKFWKVFISLIGLSLLVSCGQNNGGGNSSDKSGEQDSSDTSGEQVPGFDVESKITMNIGDTHKIVLSNVVAIESFQYSTYDDTVATVNAEGVVSAVGEGDTSILVKGGNIRKTVEVSVIDPNKLEGLAPFAKLKAIAKMDSDASSIDYSGAPLINYGWDIIPGMSHGESTATKFDFENQAEDSALIGRGGAVKNAAIYNGDYVVVMRGLASECEGDVTAMTYHKMDVSPWATQFRLWGWSNVNEAENSPLSGAGKFRVVAYEPQNAEYSEFKAYPLVAIDAGTLQQDNDGWISFSEVSNAAEGQIAGAPDYNMFIYSVNAEGKYNLKGKENIILTVQFKAEGKIAGKHDCFGIKRMGFMCDAKPGLILASDAAVELYATKTSQISVTPVGDAVNGTTNYVSSDTSIATVSNAGLITAADVTEESACTIKITNDHAPGVELSVAVTVLPTPETSFTVPESITVVKGSSVKIEITEQVSCEAGFTFESAFKGIATVDSEGNVTGVDAGSVQVKVTCGELYKYVKINVTTSSLFGMTAAQAQAMTAVETVNVPAIWDFTWSGRTVAQNVVLDRTTDDFSSNLMHLYAAPGSNVVFEGTADVLGFISGIGGTRTEAAQTAMFTKVVTPDNGAPFRLWAKTPSANSDMLDQARVRVVVYIPNEDYTSFTAYPLSFDGFCDYAAAEISKDAQDIVTYKILEDGHFFTFSTPEAARNKTGFLSIETYSIENEGNAQSRAYVRRFGWCW